MIELLHDKYFISSEADVDGVILDASDAFCTISGYSRKELIGQNHSIVRHSDTPDSSIKKMWDTITSGKTWKGVIQNKAKNGDAYWVDSTIEPMFDADGNIVGYLSFRFDVTDRIQIKMKNKLLLAQSKQAAMGEMLAMIAHQWRQPLTTVMTILSKMKMKYDLDLLDKKSFDEDFLKAKRTVMHLSKTVDDFQEYFKEKNGTPISIRNLLVNIQNIGSPIFEANEIEFSISGRCLECKVDDRLDQVLLNLYQNATDALKENRSISRKKIILILEEEKNKMVRIAVLDNGGGIDEETLSKIFFPYFSTKSKNGSGLGLYMSKDIVETHIGGTLSAKNHENGACFEMIVPELS